jgi:transposase
LRKAKERCKLEPQARVHSCYEAGRDGWWLHRWLIEQGIDNIVVDAASIEVNRRARRAKTDRLDGFKLLTMLLRHHGGERVWSVLHEPTAEQEDARRRERERARLGKERTQHTNRIRSLLVLHNLRPRIVIGGRDWAAWWESQSGQLLAQQRGEIEREIVRLSLIKQQILALEVAQREGGGGRDATDRGTAHPTARHRDQGRLAAGQGALRLEEFCQPARTCRQPGPGAYTLRQRRQPGRAGHQQGRQQAGCERCWSNSPGPGCASSPTAL